MNQLTPVFTAFQPILSVTRDRIITYGYEALARDAEGRVPMELFVPRRPEALYAFDFRCRLQALHNAVALGLSANLSLNFMPGALSHADYGLDATVCAAHDAGFPVDRLIIELTEHERVADYKPLRACIDRHRQDGLRLALDDFGVGYNGLSTLLELSPDLVKIDLNLIQKIETDYDRQSLMYGICSASDRLGIRLIAEGVETSGCVAVLSAANIDLMQGFLFARPRIGSLPEIPEQLVNTITDMLASQPFSAIPGEMRGAQIISHDTVIG